MTAVANTPAGVPTVKVHEDFQCPTARSLEESSGPAMIEQAKGFCKINLQWQPGIFMDKNLQNTGSLTATNAWGARSMPTRRSTSTRVSLSFRHPKRMWVSPATQQQMLDLGKTVGITGDAYTTFESCVTSNKYNTWAANSNAQFDKAGVSSTPSIFVNGKELPNKNLNIYDPAVLLPAIEQAAKQ